MHSKSNNRDWSLLGWSVVWLLLAGLMTFQNYQHRQEIESFKKSSAITTGVVTSASEGYQSHDEAEPPLISYRFTVNGRDYTGESEEFIPEGDSVKIRYAPNDPDKNLSINHNEQSENRYFISILCTGIGIYLFINGYSDKTAKLIQKNKFEKLEVVSFLRFPLVISGAISSYLIFNEYMESNSEFLILLKTFVFLTFLYLSVVSYLWKMPIVSIVGIGLAVFFNPIISLNHINNSWSIIERVIGFIVIITVINLKPQKLII
jgi:hypothetical protein